MDECGRGLLNQVAFLAKHAESLDVGTLADLRHDIARKVTLLASLKEIYGQAQGIGDEDSPLARDLNHRLDGILTCPPDATPEALKAADLIVAWRTQP